MKLVMQIYDHLVGSPVNSLNPFHLINLYSPQRKYKNNNDFVRI